MTVFEQFFKARRHKIGKNYVFFFEKLLSLPLFRRKITPLTHFSLVDRKKLPVFDNFPIKNIPLPRFWRADRKKHTVFTHFSI